MKNLKNALGLSFFHLCVGAFLVWSTKFGVEYLLEKLMYKVQTVITCYKLPIIQKIMLRIINIVLFSILLRYKIPCAGLENFFSNFFRKMCTFRHKRFKKNAKIFSNTKLCRKMSILTVNMHNFNGKKLSRSVAP